MARILLGSETAFRRELHLALELIDPGSLDTVSAGVRVLTPGSHRQSLRNLSGHFVWLAGPDAPQRLQVDPGTLPFEPEDIELAGLATRHLQLRLRPRPGYRPAGGALGVAGSLYLAPVNPPAAPQPVAGVSLWLQWQDEAGDWHDAESTSLSQPGGDFVCVLRLHPDDPPALDAQGALSARLALRRDGEQRNTPAFALGQGQGPLQDLPPLHWSAL